MELFSDEIFDEYSDNHFALAAYICEKTLASFDQEEPGFSELDVLVLQEAHVLLQAINELDTVDIKYVVSIQKSGQSYPSLLYQSIDQFATKLRDATRDRHLASIKERALLSLSKGFSYEFTQGDLDRIQALINETRDWLTASDIFTAEHKDRILKRLESLQRELHKKMSSLDKFWALMGDAGVALGKFGVDAKPLVDRIGEILKIAGTSQSRAEQLPSNSPLPQIKWDGERD